MARQKKKGVLHYTGRGIAYGAKGIAFLGKQSYLGVKYFVRKGSEARVQRKEKQKEKQRPFVEAGYDPFQEIHSLEGYLLRFEEKILDSSKSTIGIVIGARGTGKSALGMRLVENIRAKSQRNICAIGFRKEDLPSWIQTVDIIDNIPNGSFVLIDEAGIEFGSRDSMSSMNKLLSSLLFIARHKDLSILFLSQNSSNIEVNILRQADYLFLKHSSLLQLDFERKKVKDIYTEVQNLFDQYKSSQGLTYIYSQDFRGFVSNSLPSFWNVKVSKAYSGTMSHSKGK